MTVKPLAPLVILVGALIQCLIMMWLSARDRKLKEEYYHEYLTFEARNDAEWEAWTNIIYYFHTNRNIPTSNEILK